MTVRRETYFGLGKLGPWKIGTKEMVPNINDSISYKTDRPMWEGSKNTTEAGVTVSSGEEILIVAFGYIAQLEGPQINAFNDFNLKGKWPGITYRYRYDGNSTARVLTPAEREVEFQNQRRQRIAEAMTFPEL